MPRITGTVKRVRELPTKSGKQLTVEIVTPANTPENQKTLADLSRIWQRMARRVQADYPDQARRAYFASDVAYLAAANLDECCVLIAQDQLDRILGIIMYAYSDHDQRWHLDFLTAWPQNQPGWPGADPVRGVGMELLGEAVADMTSRQCTTIDLETLDREAEAFWRARGWHNTTEPLHLTCQEAQGLAVRLAHTEKEDPEREWVFAGRQARIRRVHSPMDPF